MREWPCLLEGQCKVLFGLRLVLKPVVMGCSLRGAPSPVWLLLFPLSKYGGVPVNGVKCPRQWSSVLHICAVMVQGGVECVTGKLYKRLRVSGPTRLFMSYWQFVRFPVSSDFPARGWSYFVTYNPPSCTFLFPLHTRPLFKPFGPVSLVSQRPVCLCVLHSHKVFPSSR